MWHFSSEGRKQWSPCTVKCTKICIVLWDASTTAITWENGCAIYETRKIKVTASEWTRHRSEVLCIQPGSNEIENHCSYTWTLPISNYFIHQNVSYLETIHFLNLKGMSKSNISDLWIQHEMYKMISYHIIN